MYLRSSSVTTQMMSSHGALKVDRMLLTQKRQIAGGDERNTFEGTCG